MSEKSNQENNPKTSNAGASPASSAVEWVTKQQRRRGQQQRGPRREPTRGASSSNGQQRTTATKFEGSTPDLKGCVFSTGEHQATTCTKTKEQIVVCATRTCGHLIAKAIDDDECKEKSILEPEEPTPEGPSGKFTCAQEMMHKERIRRCVAKLQTYQENVQSMCTIALGQCADTMKQQLTSLAEFANIDKQSDAAAPLRAIKKIAFNHKVGLHPPLAAIQALCDLCTTMQSKNMGSTAWMKAFKNQVTAAESCGVSLTGALPGVMMCIEEARHPDVEVAKLSPTEVQAVKAEGRDLIMANLCLHHASDRCNPIKEKPHNDCLTNKDGCPRMLSEAHNLIVNFKGKNDPPAPRSQQQHRTTSGATGVAFAQNGTNATDRVGKPHITCFKCGGTGHCQWEGACKPADIESLEKAKNEYERTSNESSTANTQTGQVNQEQPAAESGIQALHHADNPEFLSFDSNDDCGMACCQVEAHPETGVDYDSVTKRAGTLLNQSACTIDRNWIPLDSQSVANVMCNSNLLTNMRKVNRRMHIHCNAGVTATDLMGHSAGVGDVWHHKNGIANILSPSKVKRNHRITCDGHNGNVFRMHSTDGKTHRDFHESPKGLCCSTMSGKGVVLNLVDTVEANEEKFSNADVRRADKARRLQDTLNANLPDMLRALDNNAVLNCPATRDDMRTAEAIHGPSLVGLKGKTSRRPNKQVRTDVDPLPLQISTKCRHIHLSADIMCVNSMRFFVSLSQHLFFATAEMILNAQADAIIDCTKGITAVHTKRGFEVKTAKLDNEFRPMEDGISLLGITANFVSRGEHVPEIERFIRTVKDRVRGTQNCVPFKKCPPRLTRGIVEHNIFCWNAIPRPTGVSAVISAGAFVAGVRIDFNPHCRLQFGSCVQTHEETDNDTSHERTVGAIALRPAGNLQGGCRFMSLKTGRVIVRCNWTALPMPAEAIDRVHALAKRAKDGITFRDRDRTIIEDSDGSDDDADSADDPIFNGPDDEDTIEPTGVDEETPSNASIGTDADSDSDDDDSTDTTENESNESNEPNDDASADDDTQTVATEETVDDDDDGMRDDLKADAPLAKRKCNLRKKKPPSYRHQRKCGFIHALNAVTHKRIKQKVKSLTGRTMKKAKKSTMAFVNAILAIQDCHKEDELALRLVNEVILTQCGMKQGLKRFGQRGKDAAKVELQQFHDRKAIEPVSASSLTREQKDKALAHLMLLKGKRCGKIKGRGCADGRKQRRWTDKHNSSSPTVTTLALMLSCLMDAKQGRDVAVTDVPGAFLQTDDQSGSAHLRLEGVVVDLLLEIDKKQCLPCACVDRRGKRHMHAVCKKAICGTLSAALLFWQKLTADLEEWGFIPNQCDNCAMSETIEGSQCTVLWHVDDLKMSHVNPDAVSDILRKLDRKHGSNDAPLSTARGKVHDCLGMTLDCTIPECVMMSMTDCIHEILASLPDGFAKSESATPAADHPFNTNPEAEKLPKDMAETLHKLTAKLLFLSKRAGPDIQLPVAFLCTRVQSPDVDDWKKLARALQCLRGTIGLPLIMAVDNTGVLRWHVDAAFAVHRDMRSHTGMTLLTGRGTVTSNSSKQKLTTRSSTEAELIAVDDEMSQITWTKRFVDEQGWEVTDNVLCQDNQAATLLERNGKRSSGKRTRHLDVGCFCVHDGISAKEPLVVHCPADSMLADFHSEPLQGAKFRAFRNTILGVKELDIPRFNRLTRDRLREKDGISPENNGQVKK